MVVAEVELGPVALNVILGPVLLDALHAPPEDPELAFNRLGVDVDAAAPVDASPVVNRAV